SVSAGSEKPYERPARYERDRRTTSARLGQSSERNSENEEHRIDGHRRLITRVVMPMITANECHDGRESYAVAHKSRMLAPWHQRHEERGAHRDETGRAQRTDIDA